MNSVTQLRLDLLNNGYRPVPAHCKRAVLPGWPKVEVTAGEVERWERAYPMATTTAIRCGDVVAVDIDVDDEDLARGLHLAAVEDLGLAPVRRSVAGRRAILYRTTELVHKRITGAYRRVEGGETAGVEIRGVGCLLNVYGPHSAGIAYRWGGDALPPMEDLTAVTAQALEDYLERARGLILSAGYELVAPAVDAVVVRDITPAMVWSGRTTAELRDECERYGQVRVCMAAVRPGATNPQIGLASLRDDGTLLIHDFKTGVTHVEADHTEDDLAELGTLLPPPDPTQAAPPSLFDRGHGAAAGEGRAAESLYNMLERGDLPDCVMGARGHPLPKQLRTVRNIRCITDRMGVRSRRNMQTMEVEFPGVVGEVARAVIDECERLGIKGASEIEDAIGQIADEDRHHPMEEWIASKAWDGVPRFEQLAESVTVEAPFREVWPIYLRRWLIEVVQAAAGWRDPQQMDVVLVITGAQGIGKTTFFSALAPRQFVKEGGTLALNGFTARDSVMGATMFPIYELAELEGVFKKSDHTSLKSYLSNRFDTFRAPYARKPMSYPRRTAYCGTANGRHILRDTSGSRRFLPVAVKRIKRLPDLDRQQLWAEVYSWWKAGEQWWLTPDEELLRVALEEEHHEGTQAADVLDDYLVRCASAPAHTWLLMNNDAIGKTLGLYNASPVARGDLTDELNARLHERIGKGNKKRLVWWFPPDSATTDAPSEDWQKAIKKHRALAVEAHAKAQ